MDSFDIELFRAIISSRSITQASQALMLSQSAISQRLLRLEQELGITLIERQKGIRRVEITEQGMRFLELAEKWENSYQEILRLKDTEPDQSLVIASPDSLVNFVLGPFLKRLPELGYFPRLRTQQSLEIYDLVDNKEADVGFVFRDARYANIVTRSVLREPISMSAVPAALGKNAPFIRSSFASRTRFISPGAPPSSSGTITGGIRRPIPSSTSTRRRRC